MVGVIKGRKAIEKHFSAGHKAGARSLKLEVGTVGGSGDTAYESGAFKLYGEKSDLLGSGHYVVVWKKVNKEWLIQVDIWNSTAEEKEKAKDKEKKKKS